MTIKLWIRVHGDQCSARGGKLLYDWTTILAIELMFIYLYIHHLQGGYIPVDNMLVSGVYKLVGSC